MDQKKTKILLVEDDEAYLLLLKEFIYQENLSQNNFSCDVATTFQEADEKLRESSYDLICSDLSLPDSDYGKTVESFIEKYTHIPLIVLTGLDDADVTKETLQYGAQDYLVKGDFNSTQFIKSINYAIERSRLLAKLEKAQEHQFRKVIQHIQDGIVILNKEREILFVNEAATEMFQDNKLQLLGSKFHYETSEGFRQEIKLQKNETIDEERTVELFHSKVEWERQDAILITCRDISDIKKAERLKAEITERVKLDEAKDEFVSTVSHELRTPLTIVKGAISNLYDGVAGPLSEKQSRVVNIAKTNADRLAKLINDILDLSRLESSALELNFVEVNFVDLLNDFFRQIQLKEEIKNKTVNLEVDDKISIVELDVDLIFQVLHNLVDNALRYAAQNINIKASLEENLIKVSVSDDGCGISKEKQNLIFRKFSQIDRPSGGAGYKGTGLGLAICKQIIEQHGGSIELDKDYDSGASFYFVIPLKRDE